MGGKKGGTCRHANHDETHVDEINPIHQGNTPDDIITSLTITEEHHLFRLVLLPSLL
jgi:hypothetical protein